jgi:GTP-binding protein Era
MRSGFVALVGRPNAGKSTLTNAIVGTKVAITSGTPQTTRQRLRAVLNLEDAQLIIVDTPGLHKPKDTLGEELNRAALGALADVDVVAMLVDASQPFGRGDIWVAEHVAKVRAKRVLVITKAELATREQIDEQVMAATKHAQFDDAIAVSAVTGLGVESFIEMVVGFLPRGPEWFPRDMPTDQPIEVMLAEFIREKILRLTRDEVPHAVGVAIDDFTYDDRKDLYSVLAVVYVERDSQKGIIIGKGGEMLKTIGTQAREDLEKLLGSKVFLNLSVKVKKDWRRDASQIRCFASLCVSPFLVPLAAQRLLESPTRVCSVVAFPLGYATTEAKADEARHLVQQGCTEVDMVLNFAALLEGEDEFVHHDIQAVVAAVEHASEGEGLVKVILETAYLQPAHIERACQLAVAAGADFVKTSTGFGPRGASVEDVRLMRETVGSQIGVKASGGIRDLATTLAMIEAGASRIGCSAGIEILAEQARLDAGQG